MGGLMACKKQSNLSHSMSEKNSFLAPLEPHGGRKTPNQGRACLLRVQDEEKEMRQDPPVLRILCSVRDSPVNLVTEFVGWENIEF